MTKRLILSMALLSILFCGCKKDEPVLPTTVQISNQIIVNGTADYWDFEALVIYCYNSKGDLIQTKNITEILSGQVSTKIEVSSDVEKVRIQMGYKRHYYEKYWNGSKDAYRWSVYDYSSGLYVQTYFYLTKSDNLIITIDKNTVIGSSWK